jgi:hypothetical protein
MSQFGTDDRSFAGTKGRIPGRKGRVFHTLTFADKRFFGRFESTFLSGRRLFAVGLKARVDQRDYCIDHGMTQTLLLGDQLHQLVGAFDIRRTILQRARG